MSKAVGRDGREIRSATVPENAVSHRTSPVRMFMPADHDLDA